MLVSSPEDNPEEIFEVFWQDFDRNYSYFEYKNVNWDSLYNVYRPRINKSSSTTQLFNILSQLVAHLEDGHVNIYTPFSTYSYNDWYLKYPKNYFPNIIDNLLSSKQYSSGKNIKYGLIQNDIAYIHIASFSSQAGGYNEIDHIINSFSNAQGIILDIRGNGGGNDHNVEAIASRFMDQRRLYRYIQYRNGPNHDDFTEPIPNFISPAGASIWGNRPIIVLTNRECFSATESFLMAMKSLPNVTTIGAFTGGGSGNPMHRGLPNGWTFRLSRWVETDIDGTPFEGVGIRPDIEASINQSDLVFKRDPIINQAVEKVRQLSSN